MPPKVCVAATPDILRVGPIKLRNVFVPDPKHVSGGHTEAPFGKRSREIYLLKRERRRVRGGEIDGNHTDTKIAIKSAKVEKSPSPTLDVMSAR